MSFQHLFTPFQLGHVTLRNRIVSTPHATRFGKDGYITERYIRYHQEKARGGAGLVQCFGSSSVHPSSPVLDWNGIKNWDDSSLPMFEAFAQAIHGEGARVMSQITHRGRRGFSGPGERPLVSASDVPETENREIPHALDRGEIAEIVQAYAAAARRLQRAGFDGADLHPPRDDGRGDQVAAELREHHPVAGCTDLVAGAADPLQAAGHRRR